MKFKLIFPILFFYCLTVSAQKGKVQTAWRALSDYESSVKDGKADLSYLTKAKEAIDLALHNEDTKKQSKTHAYKARISYAYFQYNLALEIKKLEATTPDKNERIMQAYGNTDLKDFENANEHVNKIKDLDPKYIDKISEGLSKGTSTLEEDDLKFAIMAQQMKMESANIAQGKYKSKKYDEASDYFYKTAIINTLLYKVKDTANFYNSCVAAGKSRVIAKILEYNKKMIESKIATSYNYESMYNAHIADRDSASAMAILKKGRTDLPNDVNILNLETNYFLATGKQNDALTNLKASIEKEPKNAIFYMIVGQIYDGLANPKDKNTGRDLAKPDHFEESFKNAETYYLKGLEFNLPQNKETQYNLVFNLGALYNNYGFYYQNRQATKIAEMMKVQKENEAKSQEYFKKAIPYLEQALKLKEDDTPTMIALRKLYMLTKNDAKAAEMSAKLKAQK